MEEGGKNHEKTELDGKEEETGRGVGGYKPLKAKGEHLRSGNRQHTRSRRSATLLKYTFRQSFNGAVCEQVLVVRGARICEGAG